MFVNEEFDQIQQQGNSEPDVQFHLHEQNVPETDHALIGATPIRTKAKQFIDPDPDEDASTEADAMDGATTTTPESNDAAAPFFDTSIENEADANFAQEFEIDQSISAAESEDALISARNQAAMAKLTEYQHAETERMKKVVAGIRVNRAEAAEILANMHPYLIALGIWQYWCEEVVGIPVKTADSWRKAHNARTLLPPELLTAVSGIGVDISKPKVSNVLLCLADEFYEGEVGDARIAKMMELVIQATKREPSKAINAVSVTGSTPVVPIISVHTSSNGSAAVSAVRDAAQGDVSHDGGTSIQDPLTVTVTTPEKVQDVKLRYFKSDYEQFDTLEKNLRPFLGTTCKEDTVMEALRQIAILNANAQAATHSDEEVLVCV